MPNIVPFTTPNYVELTRFLIQPFLANPEMLRVDVESSHGNTRVFIRVAFDEADRARAFGRNGRNVQAIRTTIEGLTQFSGQLVRLDVFGLSNDGGPGTERRPAAGDRPSSGKPILKPRQTSVE
jgi:uncharacterized protein